MRAVIPASPEQTTEKAQCALSLEPRLSQLCGNLQQTPDIARDDHAHPTRMHDIGRDETAVSICDFLNCPVHQQTLVGLSGVHEIRAGAAPCDCPWRLFLPGHHRTEVDPESVSRACPLTASGARSKCNALLPGGPHLRTRRQRLQAIAKQRRPLVRLERENGLLQPIIAWHRLLGELRQPRGPCAEFVQERSFQLGHFATWGLVDRGTHGPPDFTLVGRNTGCDRGAG